MIAVYDAVGVPMSKRSGAAVFHKKEAFTNWLRHGYGRYCDGSEIIRVYNKYDEVQWEGKLHEFESIRELFN